jgi:uncharacterized membrane protein
LTDGLFAVAMTILVLDLHLPEGLHPEQAGLSQALDGLWSKFFPYAVSFYMLGSIWLANVRIGSKGEALPSRYVSWWLVYLLIATCLPFSTSVVSRFTPLPAAVWLYALNMAGLAAVGYRLVVLLADQSEDEYTLARKIALIGLMVSAVLSASLSVVTPRAALWAYALNFLEPYVAARILAKRATVGAPL